MCSLFHEMLGRLWSVGALTLLREAARFCPRHIGRLVGGRSKGLGPSPFLQLKKVHGYHTQNSLPRVTSDYQRFRWDPSVLLHPIPLYTQRCPRGPLLLNPRAHLEIRGRQARGSRRHGCSIRSGAVSVNHKLRIFLLLP